MMKFTYLSFMTILLTWFSQPCMQFSKGNNTSNIKNITHKGIKRINFIINTYYARKTTTHSWKGFRSPFLFPSSQPCATQPTTELSPPRSTKKILPFEDASSLVLGSKWRRNKRNHRCTLPAKMVTMKA